MVDFFSKRKRRSGNVSEAEMMRSYKVAGGCGSSGSNSSSADKAARAAEAAASVVVPALSDVLGSVGHPVLSPANPGVVSAFAMAADATKECGYI